MTERLRTQRLILRPLRASDAGPISLYAGDARVARMTTSIPHPYPPGAAELFIQQAINPDGKDRHWAVDATPIGGAEFVGVVGFHPGIGEVGYWIGPPFWNTGYVTEAVTAIVAHVFEAGLAESLVEQVFADNPASARVLEKLGFHATGAGESFSVARGEMVETRRFAVTREEWMNHVAAAGIAG